MLADDRIECAQQNGFLLKNVDQKTGKQIPMVPGYWHFACRGISVPSPRRQHFRPSPANISRRKIAGKGQGSRSDPQDLTLMLSGSSGTKAGARDEVRAHS
jgi:hypothetical protein